MTAAGSPHSDMCGSPIICISPHLFAAYHVFLRLSVPRHSPCALSCLTFSPRDSILHLPTRSRVYCSSHCGVALAPPYRPLSISLQLFLRSLYPVFKVPRSGMPLTAFRALFRGRALPPPRRPLSRAVVGSNGFEPSTSRLSGARSNQLSYEPIWWR